jgi:hypothetical protein
MSARRVCCGYWQPCWPPGARAGRRPAIPGVTRRAGGAERSATSLEAHRGVEIEIEKDVTKLFADEVEIFTDRDLLLARGNVTLTTPTQRISADSLEFNTRRSSVRSATSAARFPGAGRRPRNARSAPGTGGALHGNPRKIGDRIPHHERRPPPGAAESVVGDHIGRRSQYRPLRHAAAR